MAHALIPKQYRSYMYKMEITNTCRLIQEMFTHFAKILLACVVFPR